jgi:hypothetical protein
MEEYHVDTVVKRKALRWADVGLHLSHNSQPSGNDSDVAQFLFLVL